MKLAKSYNELICIKIDVILNPAYWAKTRRIYNKIFNLTPARRIKSWRKLDSFINIIKKKMADGKLLEQ